VIIVDCQWLLVTRVPATGDVSSTPTVRQIAESVSSFLSSRLLTESSGEAPQVDILGHSFGTAVASALVRELEGTDEDHEQLAPRRVRLRRAVLMDPMCFIPGISKQVQLLRRTPRDLAEELVAETAPGSTGPSAGEVLSSVFNKPKPNLEAQSMDEEAAAEERRKWVIYQTYFFNYFIFRDLVYCWVNLRALQGPEYLDRGLLRQCNRDGRLLTVLAETDTMIPASLLREELSDAPQGSDAGVMWLPIVGHGACQHRADVVERISRFLAA